LKDLTNISVLCFGEVLYDVFPDEKYPGGAPMNVAIHLSNLGVQSAVISAVGNDELGTELVRFIKGRAVDTSLIQVNDELPTGTVKVKLENLHLFYPKQYFQRWYRLDHAAFQV
jgi:fructokinase